MNVTEHRGRLPGNSKGPVRPGAQCSPGDNRDEEMALLKCAECGGNVSSEAPACPHCGKPMLRAAQPTPTAQTKTRPWAWILLAVIGAAVAWASMTHGNSTADHVVATGTASETAASTPAKVQQLPPGLAVDAVKLHADYKANEVAADMRYKDKSLIVTGSLLSINKDITDDPYLALDSGNEFESVHASFDKDALNQLATLERGQVIVLHCVGRGLIIGSPMLKCVTPVEVGGAGVASATRPDYMPVTPSAASPVAPLTAPQVAVAVPPAEAVMSQPSTLAVKRPGWCDKAGTNVEKMICADDELSALDAKLYAAFKAAEAQADDKKAFYANSRSWRIEQRDRCTTKDCIIDAYQVRLADLARPPPAPAAVAPVPAPVVPQAAVDPVTQLKSRGEALTDACRSGSTPGACDQREAVLGQLKGLGWCWAHTGQSASGFGWQRCFGG